MTDKIDDGGPAFPIVGGGNGFEKRVREWFNRYMDWQFDYHAAARSILERTGEK